MKADSHINISARFLNQHAIKSYVCQFPLFLHSNGDGDGDADDLIRWYCVLFFGRTSLYLPSLHQATNRLRYSLLQMGYSSSVGVVVMKCVCTRRDGKRMRTRGIRRRVRIKKGKHYDERGNDCGELWMVVGFCLWLVGQSTTTTHPQPKNNNNYINNGWTVVPVGFAIIPCSVQLCRLSVVSSMLVAVAGIYFIVCFAPLRILLLLSLIRVVS